MLTRVAVIVELYLYSGTFQTTGEFIPRLATIDCGSDFLLKLRDFILIFLLQRRVSEVIFILYRLHNLVAPFEIIPLIDSFALHTHTVIDYVKMRMVGFQMAYNKILRVLDTHAFHIFFGELSHEFIGKTWCVGYVKTYGDMSGRRLLSRHKTVDNLERLYHTAIVKSKNIVAVYYPPCVGSVFRGVVELACNITHDIMKRAAFKYPCKHSQPLYWVLICRVFQTYYRQLSAVSEPHCAVSAYSAKSKPD